MKSLLKALQEAEDKKTAIGHFNVSELSTLKAIFQASRQLNYPVIIGLSEGEREFFGVRQAAALVKSFRDEFDWPIFINADHSRDLEKIKKAVEAGFDAVMIDVSNLSLEENIKKTREVVEYVKGVNKEILVEAELGSLSGNSRVLNSSEIKGKGELVKLEEAEIFIKETNIDLLAPAVGNIHGILKDSPNPSLDIERIREVKKLTDLPLVLHGGSGISSGDILSAIEAGIRIIHINT